MDKRKTKILHSGEGHNELTKQYPKLSGFLQSAFTGEAPDEIGSVLDPLTADRQAGARAGFPLSIAAQLAPIVGPLAKWASTGSAAAKLANAVGDVGKSYVVKPKGGNWVKGQVEDIVKHWKMEEPNLEPYPKDVGITDRDGWMVDKDSGEVFGPNALARVARDKHVNNWIDKQLTRYVKNEMATPGDPIRALAEKGPIHVDPADTLFTSMQSDSRKYAGEHGKELGQSQRAKDWENISDGSIVPHTVQSITEQLPPSGVVEPWMHTADPQTPVYWGNTGLGSRVGFGHLLDELHNSVRPNSGLPPHLQLDAASLPRVSVPQAVEHVAKINEWRNAQKVEAELAKANSPAAHLHKDYPDQGYKWVELKKPDQIPEGWSQRQKPGSSQQEWLDPQGNITENNTDPRYKALEDALQYEGDTMGHCVGGYCDDVANGASRIFSLRNSKTGEPHITIETQPGRQAIGNSDKYVKFSELAPDQINQFDEYSKAMGNDPNHLRKLENTHLFNPESGTIARIDEVRPPDDIIQIKGKGNRAPVERYQPFAQDFVKSGQWGRVGDIQNTGLVRVGKEYATKPEADAMFAPRVAEARRMLAEHPALAPHREANANLEKVWEKNFSPNDAEFYRASEAAGKPVHPDIPYTYREMQDVLERPEEYTSGGYEHAKQSEYDVLSDHLDRFDKLKGLIGDIPNIPPEPNFAGGGLVTKIGPLLESIADMVKGTKVADVLGKPIEVYHGTGNVIKGPIREPAFFTSDKSGAEWYAKNRGDGPPTIHKAILNIKNPLDISNKEGAMKLIKHAEDAGVHVNVKDPGNGEPWEFYSNEISNHSPYDGESPQDLLYVPKVRDALQKAGHDGVFLHDTLENTAIPTWIPLGKDQVHHIGADAVEQNYASGGRVETQTDRDVYQRKQMEHSNQVLKQMARGWAAGTAGLPHDIDNLARMFVRPHTDPTSAIGGWARRDSPAPSTDFYNEWLPGASDDPRLQAAAETANLTGGMGLGLPAKLAARSGAAVALHAGKMLDAGVHGEGPLSKVLAPVAPMYAVKPKGGNWTEMIGHQPDVALDFHDIGSTNDYHQVNKWRNKQLLNYIKNQMGTVDDPLLKLEQEGRLHLTPEQMRTNAEEYGREPYPAHHDTDMYRIQPNHYPGDKFHYETTGRNYRTPWENLSDQAIGRHSPGEEVNALLDEFGASPEANTIEKALAELSSGSHGPAGISDAEILKKHLWLDKADPKTPIYGVGDPQGLGFQHMMDYMDQAAGAGIALEHHGSLEKMRERALGAVPEAPIHDFLPLVERNLHLSDADIARSSVADIAAKTSEWNKILAQTKTMKATAQITVHKTYDTGHVWKAVPDTATSQEGMNYALDAGRDAGWCTRAPGLAEHYGGNGNQLYVLHDASGKPKVQIAVKPPQFTESSDAPFKNARDMDPEEINAIFDHFGSSHPNRLRALDQNWKWNPEYKQWMDKESLTPSIQEIKGRFNNKPDAEDIPMVQDFVKSGQWGRVGDLHNTGLRKTSDAFNDLEQQRIRDSGEKLNEYHTPQELESIANQVWPPDEFKPEHPEDFAEGGRVNFEEGGSSDSGSSDSGNSTTTTATETKNNVDARGGYGSYGGDTGDAGSGVNTPAPTSGGKPGESQMAQTQSQETTSIGDLAKAAQDQGVSLSSLLGLGISSGGMEATKNQLSALDNLGWGSMQGVNPNNPTQSVNEMQAAARFGNFIGSAGNLALNGVLATIPGANLIRTGINAVGAYNNGMSGSDIAKNAAMDIGTGYLSADINKAIPGLIGTDAAQALGKFNTIGSLVNTVAPGTVPSVNPGAFASSFIKEQTGIPGLSNYVGTPGSKGQTTPDGSPIPDVQPWHGGNPTISGAGPLTTSVAPPEASNNPQIQPGTYDPMALGTHKLRVYDPVFKQGVRA